MEQPIDAETQKAMMSFYHKKQEEMKALAENDEDDFANSSWANPKSLKQALTGTSHIRLG